MKKVLITGVGGYIGSNTAYLLLQRGFRVTGIDNFTTGFRQPLYYLENKFSREKFQFYHRSMGEDLEDIFQTHTDIEAIIHFAACTSVPDSIQSPDTYFTNNVSGGQHVISTAHRHNVRKIIFSSTCATYGHAKYTPIDEKHPQNPTNPYGLSKLMIEQMLEWYDKSHGFKYLAFRYFNVTGASTDGEIGDSKNPSPHLVQNALRGAMGIAPFVLQSGTNNPTPDGTPIRDYVDVVDLAEAHLMGVEYLLNGGKSEAINLGTAVGSSVLEAIKTVETVTGRKLEVSEDNSRLGEDPILVASNAKAKQILNWSPQRTLTHSIQSLMKWYGKHPHGWDE